MAPEALVFPLKMDTCNFDDSGTSPKFLRTIWHLLNLFNSFWSCGPSFFRSKWTPWISKKNWKIEKLLWKHLYAAQNGHLEFSWFRIHFVWKNKRPRNPLAHPLKTFQFQCLHFAWKNTCYCIIILIHFYFPHFSFKIMSPTISRNHTERIQPKALETPGAASLFFPFKIYTFAFPIWPMKPFWSWNLIIKLQWAKQTQKSLSNKLNLLFPIF